MKNLKEFFLNRWKKIKEDWQAGRHQPGNTTHSKWVTFLFGNQTHDSGVQDFVGIRVSVERWSYWVRPIVSLSAGFLVGTVFAIILVLTPWVTLVDFGFWWLVMFVFITLLTGWPDGNETVPGTTSAMVTFMGSRKRFYRLEGDYVWTGKLFLLGRSKIVKDEGTDSEGFILMEPFQVKIWNSSKERGVTQIEAQAKNNATVYTTLTLTNQHFDPMKWVNNEDPVLSLSERAREGFRGAIRCFTDSDCAGLKNKLGQIMEGYSLIASVLPASYTKKRKFSVINDKAGQMLTEMIKREASEDEVAEALSAYKTKVNVRANKEEREQCTEDGELIIETYTVDNALKELANDLGTRITDASVGNFQMSDAVKEVANKTSSEDEQRDGQLKSAQTIADASKTLGEAEKKYGQMAVAIAAGADKIPGVKVVIVGGQADRLSRAAAVHGSLKDKGDD